MYLLYLAISILIDYICLVRRIFLNFVIPINEENNWIKSSDRKSLKIQKLKNLEKKLGGKILHITYYISETTQPFKCADYGTDATKLYHFTVPL